MKQAAQFEGTKAQGAAKPSRPQTAQPGVAPGGCLAQLAAMMNGSPGTQKLSELKNASQRSPQAQKLMALDAAINQNLDASSRALPVSENAAERHPIQGKFLLRNPGEATAQMKAAVKVFMAAIREINGELVQLIDSSDDINVIIDPGTALGVAGSGETKLERQTNEKGKPETFADTLSEIVSTTKVTDEMRTQPLVLRIKVNQKGLLGASSGSVAQLAETLAHEYSLHAEAQLEAIKALRDRSLSNEQALKTIVESSNDRGGFNNAEAQHAELETQKGARYDAMVAVVNVMKRNLTTTDAAALQKAFEDDTKDRH